MNQALERIRTIVFGNPLTTLVALGGTIYLGFYFKVLTGPQIFQLALMIFGFASASDGGKGGDANGN